MPCSRFAPVIVALAFHEVLDAQLQAPIIERQPDVCGATVHVRLHQLPVAAADNLADEGVFNRQHVNRPAACCDVAGLVRLDVDEMREALLPALHIFNHLRIRSARV